MPTDISEFQVKISDPETPPKLWVKFLGCVLVSIPFMALWLAILKGFNLVKSSEFEFWLGVGITVCLGESLQETFGEFAGGFARLQLRSFRKRREDAKQSEISSERTPTETDNEHTNKTHESDAIGFLGRFVVSLFVCLIGFLIVTALKLPFPSEHKLWYPVLICYPLALATIGTYGGRVGTRIFQRKTRVGS